MLESQRLGQGRENAKNYLKQNPAAAAKIEQAIRANAGVVADKILEDGGESEGEE